jgi:hypothetical protein
MEEVLDRAYGMRNFNNFRQCKKASIPSGEHPKMDLVLG